MVFCFRNPAIPILHLSVSLSLQGVLKSWKKPRHFIRSLLFLHLKPATTIEKNVRKSNWGILSPMFKVKMPKNRLIDHRLRTGGRLQTFVVRPQALLKPIINDLKNFVPNLHTPRIEDTPQTMSPAWIPKYQHGIWAWNKLTEGYVVGMWFVHEWYPPTNKRTLRTKEIFRNNTWVPEEQEKNEVWNGRIIPYGILHDIMKHINHRKLNNMNAGDTW